MEKYPSISSENKSAFLWHKWQAEKIMVELEEMVKT